MYMYIYTYIYIYIYTYSAAAEPSGAQLSAAKLIVAVFPLHGEGRQPFAMALPEPPPASGQTVPGGGGAWSATARVSAVESRLLACEESIRKAEETQVAALVKLGTEQQQLRESLAQEQLTRAAVAEDQRQLKEALEQERQRLGATFAQVRAVCFLFLELNFHLLVSITKNIRSWL